VDGCQLGTFVLKLTRPDGSARTWWHTCPDETAMADPALELVLPEAAELEEISPDLLEPGRLPSLWPGETITVQTLLDYFRGGNVIQIQHNNYVESLPIPKAKPAVVNDAVAKAVEAGKLWLSNGPASLLAEPIPAGVLTPQAVLQHPPAIIAAAEILPENLPDAWSDGESSALAIATALSQKSGLTLPWKTVRDVIDASLNARFTQLEPTSGAWPCEYPAAQSIKLKVAAARGEDGDYTYSSTGGGEVRDVNIKWAEAELEPSQMQDLGDAIPPLLTIKSKSGCPMTFKVQIKFGEADHAPDEASIAEINKILTDLKPGFHLS
jgi:hypothetical protein